MCGLVSACVFVFLRQFLSVHVFAKDAGSLLRTSFSAYSASHLNDDSTRPFKVSILSLSSACRHFVIRFEKHHCSRIICGEDPQSRHSPGCQLVRSTRYSQHRPRQLPVAHKTKENTCYRTQTLVRTTRQPSRKQHHSTRGRNYADPTSSPCTLSRT